ncbi:MAG: chromate transporter [Xanthobacteraceae bacterium]
MALPEKPSAEESAVTPTPHVSLFALYRTFFWVGLFSFGGGLSAWLHREVVQLRGWLTEEQFFSGYSLSQVLPGVNSSNLSVYLGQHLRGTLGAVVALTGLLTGPFIVVIGAATVYQYLLTVPGFPAAMAGIAAAAIGLLVRLALTAARGAIYGVAPVLVMAATFLAVGILRWPLVPVVLVMAPISIALAWPRKSPDA